MANCVLGITTFSFGRQHVGRHPIALLGPNSKLVTPRRVDSAPPRHLVTRVHEKLCGTPILSRMCFPVLSSSWRTVVLGQAQRLQNDLALVPAANRKGPEHAQTLAALERGRAAARQPTTPARWWSGALVEEAWGSLQAAREALVLIQDESVLRAQLPYLRELSNSNLRGEVESFIGGATINRAVLRQVFQQHHVGIDIQQESVRRLRNLILGMTLLLTAVLTAAVVTSALVSDHMFLPVLVIVVIGGVAGTLTTVLPLSTAPKAIGPYAVTGAQALLKVPAGAAAALLGVLLLRHGLGGFSPAKGDAAIFYAVLFGFSQQLLTRLVDTQAEELVKGVTPRA